MATDAEKIVTDFCNAWPRKNIDELIGFFTDDAVYHNIPMEPAKGKDAIRGVINTFLPMAKSLEFKILNYRRQRQRGVQRARRHLRPGQRQENRAAGGRRVRSHTAAKSAPGATTSTCKCTRNKCRDSDPSPVRLSAPVRHRCEKRAAGVGCCRRWPPPPTPSSAPPAISITARPRSSRRSPARTPIASRRKRSAGSRSISASPTSRSPTAPAPASSTSPATSASSATCSPAPTASTSCCSPSRPTTA